MVGKFSDESLARFYDFATCQRPDGSTYGTGGTCRKGVQITKTETGVFVVKDADGKAIGHIRTSVGGGASESSGGRSSARYDATLNGKKKEGVTLAQAKTWVKEQLGEKTGGDAKVAIKGGLTAKGKAKRLENINDEISDVRGKFNSEVAKWNAIPKEERKNHPNLRKSIEYLKAQYEKLTADRKMIQDTPEREG